MRRRFGGQALARQVEVLPRDFGQRLQRRELLQGRIRQAHITSTVYGSHCARAGGLDHAVGKGHFVELEQGALAVAEGQRRTFFNEVIGERVDAAFGELRVGCQSSWHARGRLPDFSSTQRGCSALLFTACTHLFAT